MDFMAEIYDRSNKFVGSAHFANKSLKGAVNSVNVILNQYPVKYYARVYKHVPYNKSYEFVYTIFKDS